MSEFEINTDKTVLRYQGSFIRVETLEYHNSDGSIHHRDVVRHPGAVVVIPYLTDAKAVLLIEQYRIAANTNLAELPAGKRDIQGEDPLDCAKRELEEELGLTASSMVHLISFYNTPGFCDEYTHLYLARGLSPGVHAPQGIEELAAKKKILPLADFEDAMQDQKIFDAKTFLGIFALRNHLENSLDDETYVDSIDLDDFELL